MTETENKMLETPRGTKKEQMQNESQDGQDRKEEERRVQKRKTSQQKEEETVKKTKYKAYLNVFHGLWLSWPES